MSKNPVIKSRYAAPYTLTLKLSEKAGLYYVISGAEQTGKANFFPGNKKYWNTDEDIAAAEQHLITLITNKHPKVAKAFGVGQIKGDAIIVDDNGDPIIKDMVDSPYGLITQDQYDVMVGGENPNNIQVPGPTTQEEEMKDIAIGKGWFKDEVTQEYSIGDSLWHIITIMDGAMLCQLGREDWDDVSWEPTKMVSKAEILTQENMCPKCMVFTVSDPFCGGCGALMVTNGVTNWCVQCGEEEPDINKEEEVKKNPLEMHLLECDRWQCGLCFHKMVEDAEPFDIKDFQMRHCEWNLDKHGHVECSYCGITTEKVNNKEEVMDIIDINNPHLQEWALTMGAHGLSMDQVEWIRPFIDFVKLCNHVNHTLKTGFIARHCTINGAGEIHSKDNYMGVVLLNNGFIFVDKEGNITPMSQFKAAKPRKEDQGYVVTRDDGSTVHWFNSLKEAGKFASDHSTTPQGLRVYKGTNKKGKETFSVYLPAPTNNNTTGGK